MAVLRGSQVIIANIGDSRTYLLRNHELRLITRDHSLVATLVLEGQILPNEIYTHPQRNVIYRYLGQKDEIQPDLYRYFMQPGDKLLLCSDGLWEMIRSEAEIAEMLEKAGDPQQACRDLINAAKRHGGEDNISAIVVKAF
jgi:protein phosphatase